ncbi:MAG: STAS domain-containing protein [Armatimonadota bacterium]
MEDNKLQVSTDQILGTPVITANGDIDIYSVASFRSSINEVLDTGANELIIDLKGVEYVDSSGFGALLGATKRVKPIGGKIILVGCSPSVARMMRITQLDTIFEIFEDCTQAVDSIKIH